MTIRIVETDRWQYRALLLLADEQEDMVDRYLERGTMYVLEDGGAVRAECVVTDEGDGVLELKNLAVAPAVQGRGYGRRLVEFLAETYAGTFRTMQVGTGDSPATRPFYERCGFTLLRFRLAAGPWKLCCMASDPRREEKIRRLYQERWSPSVVIG